MLFLLIYWKFRGINLIFKLQNKNKVFAEKRWEKLFIRDMGVDGHNSNDGKMAQPAIAFSQRLLAILNITHYKNTILLNKNVNKNWIDQKIIRLNLLKSFSSNLHLYMYLKTSNTFTLHKMGNANRKKSGSGNCFV